MKKNVYFIICLLALTSTLFAQNQRWSEEKANNWYRQFNWLTGMNYIPSDAINYTAMWDKTSFNPQLMEKEMALAESIGFNCARVVLQYAVYADDPEYFLKTFDKFLSICNKHGVKVMPCFFDDCYFGVNTDPVIGKQVEPLKGWYAWAWSPSPGHTMVVDQRFYPQLEKYVKEVMYKFKDDKRILLWDLYNEPTNGGLGFRSLPLVKKVFEWGQAVNPSQPLSIAAWNSDEELNKIIYAYSDVITFHCYDTKEKTAAFVQRLKEFNRPIICTEWLNRPVQSTIEDIMPLMKEQKVGSMIWGFVNGKTQTHLPWGFRPEKLPYTGVWQHDIFTKDFKPYKQEEIELIKRLTGK